MNNFEKTSAQDIISQAEQSRWAHQSSKFGRARILLLGVAGVSFTLGFMNKYVYQKQSQAEVDYRKQRLSQPITELTSADGTQIPWSKQNVDSWLYKPVRITGRPLHNRACLIPSKNMGLDGYEYVVPLCTKETADGIPIEGVFLNKGFMPHDKKDVATRYRIEDSFHQQTFTAYLSKMPEHSEHSALQPGNSPFLPRNKWNYVELDDMAKVSGFENKAVVSAGVLQSVNLDSDLNERNGQITDISCDYREDFPYRKTMAGALQSNNMPWDYRNKGDRYVNFGLASGVLALLLSF